MPSAPISSEGRRVMASPDDVGTRHHGAALSNLAERADHPGPDHEHDGGEQADGHALPWPDALRIAGVALAAILVWFRLWLPPQIVPVIGVFGLLIGGWPIVTEAAKNALARRMTMELSMTMAIVAAAAISEFFTALVITLFVLAAEVLEGMTVARGRRSIRDLLDALPRTVSVRRAGGVRDVDSDQLKVGDAVLVSPGGLIPVDGEVVSGHSFVDQARITGESMPIEKVAATTVYAGSINASGVLEIRAERIGRDTSYGRIIEAVERARRRPGVEPDGFVYTPGRGIAAEVAGTRVLVGNRAWMRDHGVVMPDGVPGVAGHSATAAASEVFVARSGRLLGAIAVADTVRPEAQRAIDALGRMRLRTILLTGDTRGVAEAVASGLDIQEVEADLLPEDKLQRINRLVAAGRTVAMIGDGINDAPALAAASVGVGMGSGTDVARESADVVLLGNDLARFVETLAVARSTRGIIWQNFAGTLAVDALGVGLAAFGFLGPLFAAFIHVASELTFILNSARLLPPPRAVS